MSQKTQDMDGQYVPSIFHENSCVTSLCFATAALESPISTSTFIVGLEASNLKRQEVPVLQKIIHREAY